MSNTPPAGDARMPPFEFLQLANRCKSRADLLAAIQAAGYPHYTDRMVGNQLTNCRKVTQLKPFVPHYSARKYDYDDIARRLEAQRKMDAVTADAGEASTDDD